LLQELYDIILNTPNKETEQRKQEMDQRREEHKELKALMERVTTVVLEYQTRIEIAGTRIRDLRHQEACRDTFKFYCLTPNKHKHKHKRTLILEHCERFLGEMIVSI